MNPRNTHIGLSNYSAKAIQPYDIWRTYKLDPFRSDIIKRILRTKIEPNMTLRESKLLDLYKIKHIVETMIQDYEENSFPWDPIIEDRTDE